MEELLFTKIPVVATLTAVFFLLTAAPVSYTHLSEDVLPEFKRFSESFNGMIHRLDAGFAAQRQFSGNAAHELRTPLALMQTQMELFAVEHPDVPPATNDLLTPVSYTHLGRSRRLKPSFGVL